MVGTNSLIESEGLRPHLAGAARPPGRPGPRGRRGRAWLRQDTAPAYWFGAGRGYADIALRDLDAPASAAPGDTLALTVTVASTGARAGQQVVQVYAERPDSAVDRPVRWLVGFAPVRVDAGATAEVRVEVPTRLLAHWDSGWHHEPGDYVLRAGTSVVDLPYSAKVRLA